MSEMPCDQCPERGPIEARLVDIESRARETGEQLVAMSQDVAKRHEENRKDIHRLRNQVATAVNKLTVAVRRMTKIVDGVKPAESVVTQMEVLKERVNRHDKLAWLSLAAVVSALWAVAQHYIVK